VHTKPNPWVYSVERILIVLAWLVLPVRLVIATEQLDVAQKIQSVAVLRFSNFSRQKDAGKILGYQLSTVLATQRFIVIPTEATDEFVAGLGDFELDRRVAQQLGRELDVRYVLYGSVVEYSYLRRAVKGFKEPVVGLTARLVEVNTGRVVWAKSDALVHPETATEELDGLTAVAQKIAKNCVRSLVEYFNQPSTASNSKG